MAYTATHTRTHLVENANLIEQFGTVDVTEYNSTLVEITGITGSFGTLLHVVPDPVTDNGYVPVWDYTNKAFKMYNSPGTALTISPLAARSETIGLTDADTAASAGVALYVHIDEVLEQGSYLGHLECATAGNADTTFALSNGGATVKVQDDDNAATGGLAVYFDEDGTSGARLLANTGHAVYIMASDGTYVKITHNATPGTPGVQVYLDDDASNDYEKLLFVSPTNADGTDVVYGPVNTATEAAYAEADNAVDAGAFRYRAVGLRP